MLFRSSMGTPVSEGVLRYQDRDVRVPFTQEKRDWILGIILAIRAAKGGDAVRRSHQIPQNSTKMPWLLGEAELRRLALTLRFPSASRDQFCNFIQDYAEFQRRGLDPPLRHRHWPCHVREPGCPGMRQGSRRTDSRISPRKHPTSQMRSPLEPAHALTAIARHRAHFGAQLAHMQGIVRMSFQEVRGVTGCPPVSVHFPRPHR